MKDPRKCDRCGAELVWVRAKTGHACRNFFQCKKCRKMISPKQSTARQREIVSFISNGGLKDDG